MEQNKKMIIYQVLPRLFGNLNATLTANGSVEENGVGKFSSFTLPVLKRIKELGITHVWYTGIIEHATDTDYSKYGIRPDHSVIVKGKAGSPYAIKDYYDVDPDLADDVPSRMAEFEQLVERTHRAGMKVITDFVANHVSRQYFSDARLPYVDDLGQHDDTSVAFRPDNNFYYIPGQPLGIYWGKQQEDIPYCEFPARATGNDCFHPDISANDWYETVKLNYGVDYQHGMAARFNPMPDTWKKMLDILLFWAGKGIDGFRCDMAEMVPVEFWNWVIPEVKKAHADIIFIAEIYKPDQYRNYLENGHFDFLYDKVGMYDTLRAVVCNQATAYDITGKWQATEGFQDRMLYFLENHDEQRIASDFFAADPRKAIPAMIVAATMNTNPVMIYNGQELGERGMDEEGFSGRDGRTTIFDYWSMASVRDWINGWTFDGAKLTEEQQSLRLRYQKLLNIAQSEPAIVKGKFYDLMYANPGLGRQYVFLRKYRQEVILVAANFHDAEQTININIPPAAFDALGIKDNAPAKRTDLVTEERTVGTLTASCPYHVVLPPHSGTILKFSFA